MHRRPHYRIANCQMTHRYAAKRAHRQILQTIGNFLGFFQNDRSISMIFFLYSRFARPSEQQIATHTEYTFTSAYQHLPAIPFLPSPITNYRVQREGHLPAGLSAFRKYLSISTVGTNNLFEEQEPILRVFNKNNCFVVKFVSRGNRVNYSKRKIFSHRQFSSTMPNINMNTIENPPNNIHINYHQNNIIIATIL